MFLLFCCFAVVSCLLHFHLFSDETKDIDDMSCFIMSREARGVFDVFAGHDVVVFLAATSYCVLTISSEICSF